MSRRSRKGRIIDTWYDLRPDNTIKNVCSKLKLSHEEVSSIINEHLVESSTHGIARRLPIGVQDVYHLYKRIYTKAFRALELENNKKYRSLKDYYTKIQDYEMLAAVVKAKDDFNSRF